jgi:hypothetical protein
MGVTVIVSTKWVDDGEKVVLTEFDCFPSIEAHGPITWTPADQTIKFTKKKPWSEQRGYITRCSGDVTEKGGTQCYTTATGATECFDEGSKFTMEGGSISMVQLILVDPPKPRKSRMTLSNMKRSLVSADSGTTYTGGAEASKRG